MKLLIDKMEHKAVICGLIVLAWLQMQAHACGLVWDAPSSFFDGVDFQGNVHVIQKLGELNIGKDQETFPIYAIFNSSNHSTSPYGGAIQIPLLESKLEQVDESTFIWRTPSGWIFPFVRNRKDTSILDGSSGFKAEIKGDVVTAWAPCGDKVVFSRGRITRLQIKDKKLNFSYAGNSVSEILDGDGRVLLKVLTDSSTGDTSALVLGSNQNISLQMGTKPRIQNIGGKNVITGMDKVLSKITLPDGSTKSFDFSVDPQVRATLKINGDSEIAWGADGKIIHDGEWQYTIKPGEGAFANAAIERRNSSGRKESWNYDSSKGEEVIKFADGRSISTKTMPSVAGIGGLLRSKQITDASGKKTLQYQASYDEAGNLIRQVFNDKQYSFDKAGNIQLVTIDGNVIYDAKKLDLQKDIYGIPTAETDATIQK